MTGRLIDLFFYGHGLQRACVGDRIPIFLFKMVGRFCMRHRAGTLWAGESSGRTNGATRSVFCHGAAPAMLPVLHRSKEPAVFALGTLSTERRIAGHPAGGVMATNFSAEQLDRYLNAIVALTRHRDPQELAAALLAQLRANIPAREIRLFSISNHDRDTEFNPANAQNAIVYDAFDVELDDMALLADDPEFLSAVLTQAPHTSGSPGDHRVIIPVFGAHHVSALLVIDGLRDPALPYELLNKLLQVYGNQTFMLSRGQLDPLTGLYNRQSFYVRIRQVASRTSAQRRAHDDDALRGGCFALLDIDYFKQVNDRYGHLYGDEVLLLLARLMTRSFRHEDLLFRYGGEEFAVVLINVDMESAERLLERFRRAVEAYSFPRLEPKTVSVGYTALTTEIDVDKVVMCADKALYYAKNNGRNQVCCYEKLIAEGKVEPVTAAEGDIELF